MNTAIATSPMSGSSNLPLAGQKTAHRTDTPKRSFLPSHLATAALLLLTIVGGLYAVGTPGNLGLLHQSSPSVENELIASADVEMMPDIGLANVTFTGISRFTLEPGESMDSGPASYYGDGVYLFEVEAGVLSLVSTGPTELLTGGSDQGTPVSDGISATLRTGDRGVIWPGVATTWRNDGQIPTVVLIAAAGQATNDASELDQIDLVKSFSMEWPEPPVTFTFRRLTFEPGSSLPLADIPGPMMFAVASGEIDVPISYADGSTSDRGFDPTEGFLANNWHLAMDGDMRNSGSESVVIYVLTGESIVPAKTPAA